MGLFYQYQAPQWGSGLETVKLWSCGVPWKKTDKSQWYILTGSSSDRCFTMSWSVAVVGLCEVNRTSWTLDSPASISPPAYSPVRITPRIFLSVAEFPLEFPSVVPLKTNDGSESISKQWVPITGELLFNRLLLKTWKQLLQITLLICWGRAGTKFSEHSPTNTTTADHRLRQPDTTQSARARDSA